MDDEERLENDNIYLNCKVNILTSKVKMAGNTSKPTSNKTRRETGDLGFWSLSSCKVGNGSESLRDDNIATFWQ